MSFDLRKFKLCVIWVHFPNLIPRGSAQYLRKIYWQFGHWARHAAARADVRSKRMKITLVTALRCSAPRATSLAKARTLWTSSLPAFGTWEKKLSMFSGKKLSRLYLNNLHKLVDTTVTREYGLAQQKLGQNAACWPDICNMSKPY